MKSKGELLVDSCKAGLSYFDGISSEALVDMRKMTSKERLKALRVKEAEIQRNYEYQIAELETREEIARIENETKIRLSELETQRVRIAEQSKCLQKLIEAAETSYKTKFDFFTAQLKSAENFFLPQLESISLELKDLHQQRDRAIGNQELFILLQSQISYLSKEKNEINERYMKIQSDLTYAANISKLELNTSIKGLLI